MSVLAPIPFATSTVVMIVVSTIWLFSIDVWLGVVADRSCSRRSCVTNVVYERAVSVHFTRAQDQLGEFSAGVHESFEGVQLVKSYGAEERETERLAGLADQVRASRVQGHPPAELVRGLPRRDPVAREHPARGDRRGSDAVERSVRRRVVRARSSCSRCSCCPLRLIGFALSELPRSIAAWKRVQTVSTSRSKTTRPTRSTERARARDRTARRVVRPRGRRIRRRSIEVTWRSRLAT